MNTALLLFVAGVFAKTAMSLLPGFKKIDLTAVGIALCIGLVVGADELSENGINSAVLTFSVVFIACIAFLCKEKILPKITEGTLLLYGFVSLYLTGIPFRYIPFSNLDYGIVEQILIAYCLVICVLCVTKIRIHPIIQTVLATCFILSNLIIIVAFVQFNNFSLFFNPSSLESLTNFGIFFTGYAFFQLVSNLLFVLYFIPIPLSKGQSFSHRISAIKGHASDLEKKYIDIVIVFKRSISVFTLFTLLFLNGFYALVDEALMISLALILGDFLTAAPHMEDANQETQKDMPTIPPIKV